MSARTSKPVPAALIERMTAILASFEAADPGACWEWPRYRNPQTGYGQMNCRIGGKAVQFTAHRVALSTVSIAPSVSACALHKCDNPSCVNPAHLYWGSQAQNVADMFSRRRNPDRSATAKRGAEHWSARLKDRMPKGEAVKKSKLTESAVLAIRASTETLSVLAKRYGVTQTAVSYVKRGKTWRHVSQES